MDIENIVAIVLIAQLPVHGRTVGDRDILAAHKPMPRSSSVAITAGNPWSRSS